MHAPEWNIVLSLGLVLSAALAGGWLAHKLNLPRVTAYLLVGLALGPHASGLIPEGHIEHLDPICRLAMALVLLNMGCHFTVEHFHRIARRALRLSAGEVGLTFLLVASGLWLIGQGWQASLLFGALAIATAPATTALVLKELESDGPVTELTITLVALNNLLAVVVFEIILAYVGLERGTGAAQSLPWELQRLGIDLAGSGLLGVAGGLVISYACGLWPREHWLVLLVATTTLVLGFCTFLHVPYLLTFLAMGTTIACTSDRAAAIVDEMDRITGLLCVVFFVIHGSEFDLRQLRTAGLVGIAYIVLRSVGKYFGAYLVADSHEDGVEVRRWLGATLWPQAGAAIALSAAAAAPEMGLGELGVRLQTVILGTVIYFEIVGPVAIRRAVVRSGEVPLDRLIHHTTTTPSEQIRLLANRLLMALGINPWHGRPPQEVTVGQLVRRNVKGIAAGAHFDEVIDFIEQSHDNIFAVVDGSGVLVGVIRYAELRDALFDPVLDRLVCAADLATPVTQTLPQNAPVSAALDLFRHGEDDCVPVVSGEESPQLVGMVRRRDLFRYFLRSPSQGSRG